MLSPTANAHKATTTHHRTRTWVVEPAHQLPPLRCSAAVAVQPQELEAAPIQVGLQLVQDARHGAEQQDLVCVVVIVVCVCGWVGGWVGGCVGVGVWVGGCVGVCGCVGGWVCVCGCVGAGGRVGGGDWVVVVAMVVVLSSVWGVRVADRGGGGAVGGGGGVGCRHRHRLGPDSQSQPTLAAPSSAHLVLPSSHPQQHAVQDLDLGREAQPWGQTQGTGG